MSKISVIVPVYKVEAYLDRCVKSILDQTFEDFELILVDDGSPDRCGVMCDGWAAKDRRIRVIHKENGGLSDARNAGINAALGDWLTFIDSDDYVHPNMFQVLLDAAYISGTSVSICTYQRTRGGTLVVEEIPRPKIWLPEDYYLSSNINATIACAKLYKRTCFEKLRYPVGKIHEDEFLTYRILFQEPKIVVVDAPLYGYFYNDESITRGSWSPRRMDVFDAYTQQIQFFLDNKYIRAAKRQCRNFAQNIRWQIQLIDGNTSDEIQRKNIRVCRIQMRQVLQRYKNIAGFSICTDTLLYQTAYPKAKYVIWFFALFCRGVRKIQRMCSDSRKADSVNGE